MSKPTGRPNGRPKSIANSECETCGKPIVRYPSQMRRFCSSLCYGKSQVRLAPDFWANVDRRTPDECWLWKAGTSGRESGYGTIKFQRAYDYAHRVAYRLTYGDIPKGQFVRHLCATRLCCNPRHLAIGTHDDNMDDMVEFNRQQRYADIAARRKALEEELRVAEGRVARLRRALDKLEVIA